MKQVYYSYDTPYGKITVVSNGSAVVSLKHENNITPACEKKADAITDMAAKQLGEYFSGKRKEFDVPLAPQGTEFQQRVWSALREIPYGETRSYRQVAEKAGNPKACRAAGSANNRNPIWIIIPCHRVIGTNGSLTGYAGGLDMKRKVLELEKSTTR